MLATSCSDAQHTAPTASPTTSPSTSPTTVTLSSTVPPTTDAPATTSASVSVPAKQLVLRSDAVTLASRPLDGGAFDGRSAAVSADELIMVSKTSDSGIELYSFTEGRPPVDTGVAVSAGTSLKFGPGGDLFAVEYGREGKVVVSQFGRADDGRLVLRNSASGPTGECGIAITPEYAGCPTGVGPQITFDPPIPFDQVLGDSLLAGSHAAGVVERTGSNPKRWQVSLDSDIPIDCTDNTCEHEWWPGPAGSAIYVPYLDTPAGGNHLAVFVVDDRATATGALLDPADVVLGVIGTELIGVQQAGGGEQLIAFDLSPLLA